jgi:sugar lactone lactonase YvrE
MIANADGTGRRQIAADLYHSVFAVRGARTGALVKRFDIPGRAVSIAMASKYLAVVEWKGGSRFQLRRYRPDGRFLGAASLPKGVFSVMGGARALVYAAGGRIFAVDALTGRTRVVARPVAFEGGLSILNRRVVWAESASRNRTRIRAIDLPR